MKKLESYLLDNMDVAGYMVREINAWGGYLEHLEYFDMEELDLVLEGYTPSEVANRIFYGDFNPNDEYFRFNAYANLESANNWDIEEEYRDYISEIASYIVEYKDNIDIYDEGLQEILDNMEVK